MSDAPAPIAAQVNGSAMRLPYLKRPEPRRTALNRLAKLGTKPFEPADATGRVDLAIPSDDWPFFEYLSDGLLGIANEEELVLLYYISREQPEICSIRHQTRWDHSPSTAQLSIHRSGVELSREG